MTELTITNHATEKGKERAAFKKKTLPRMANKAFREGLTHKQAKGKLHHYISSLWEKNMNVNNIRIYGEFVYFFAGTTLVTMYQLPQELRRQAIKQQEKVRK